MGAPERAPESAREGRSDEPAGATIAEALDALRAGHPVLVTDDLDRENEGDVVLAAQTLSTEWVGWTIRHTSGYLCAPMTAERADELQLPLMVTDNADPLRTAYTVSVDAAAGVTTGISAADRARTAQVLADPTATAADLVRPGHLIPLRARPGGVLERRGHTEATVDLCRLAGLAPVGVIGELVHDDGSMMRRDDVADLAAREGIPVITIAALVEHRQRHDRVERVAVTSVPTAHGRFEAIGYRDRLTGDEHLALVSPRGLGDAPLVRVHSECLTGDALGSLRCDCGAQLDQALAQVASDGGAVVYLRGHEGRGVGLLSKLAAYAAQDTGCDTVDAQVALGLPIDARDYTPAAAILHDLAATEIHLLSNNPDKRNSLRDRGIEVISVQPLVTRPTADNVDYLRAKRDRMGHDLPHDHLQGATA
ncbi:3,4-dihydroxy-2-butanone-4-phosphate synthase [Calidifontibacter sp. DB0510]|uniref:Multifunctional fusion protein n=2 Tax=Metallococcus carri TaxID=1656884 RepID=A0A967E9M0_9MICO|nr:3,4-dihydroxy-2-butanone-4-phosphate synthase [Metallococcus carri]NOP37340.1 3,4-dihydroxy-2-butanone-4-phosphate synthase [Calidifontibacter sp. DB2511S]